MGGKMKGLFSSPKSNHQKGEMKFPLSTKVKMNLKLVIVILSVFVVWEGHIASQCPNKRTMITCIDGEVETESDGDDDQIPSLKDACDDNVKYPVEGKSLVARRALSAQVKEDATSTIRYVV